MESKAIYGVLYNHSFSQNDKINKLVSYMVNKECGEKKLNSVFFVFVEAELRKAHQEKNNNSIFSPFSRMINAFF